MAGYEFDLVILGASGNLVMSKLFPSILRAFNEQEINLNSRILLCSRKAKQVDHYKSQFYAQINETIDDNSLLNDEIWRSLPVYSISI